MIYLAKPMTPLSMRSLLVVILLLLLGGCASRPINPPITQADPTAGYRFETRLGRVKQKESLVILAFSGGGTRAAAFSYGVLEFLRRTEVVGPQGQRVRLLDQVDVITGVSGGSFTALAYGLYGDRLFSEYEQRFLKRDVQGEIIARTFSPATGAVCGLQPGAVQNWRPSCTTKSCSMVPPSAI
jgi:NTE family protein